MKGAFKATGDAVCKKCGNTQFKNQFDEFINHSVPKCTKCGGPPSKIALVKSQPSLNGKGHKQYYYSDPDTGEALSKISDAIALMGKLNDKLRSGSFRPQDFDKDSRKALQFKNYADKYVKIYENRQKLPAGHEDHVTLKTFRNKKGLIERELKPYFKDIPIDKITRHEIDSFRKSYIDKWRTRDLALGELRAMLNYAYEELEYIDKVPPFKKIARARELTIDELPSKQVQIEIINAIYDRQYRAMFIVMATLGVRPCEVRSYKVEDVDFINKRIVVRSHFSGNQELDGRKSVSKDESMGTIAHKLDEKLLKIMNEFVKEKESDDFLFAGKRGAYVSESVLGEAWTRASKKLGYVKTNERGNVQALYRPYASTKSTTSTNLLKEGKSVEKVSVMLGHKNLKTTLKYAKIAAIDSDELIDSSAFTWED